MHPHNTDPRRWRPRAVGHTNDPSSRSDPIEDMIVVDGWGAQATWPEAVRAAARQFDALGEAFL